MFDRAAVLIAAFVQGESSTFEKGLQKLILKVGPTY